MKTPMTNYTRLFGTPEKAAKTLARMELTTIEWCEDDGSREACKRCPYEFDSYGCFLPDDFSLEAWLCEESC